MKKKAFSKCRVFSVLVTPENIYLFLAIWDFLLLLLLLLLIFIFKITVESLGNFAYSSEEKNEKYLIFCLKYVYPNGNLILFKKPNCGGNVIKYCSVVKMSISHHRSQFCSIQNKQLVQTNESQTKLILNFSAVTFFEKVRYIKEWMDCITLPIWYSVICSY